MVSPPDPPEPPESRDAAAERSRSGSRRWSVRLVAGLAALYALLLLANAVLPTTGARPSMVGAIRARAGVHGMPVWTAYTRCGAGKVVAGGFALYLDTVGDRPGSGKLRMADVACVLGVLEAPSSLFDAIGHAKRSIRWRVAAKTFAGPCVGSCDYVGTYEFIATWTYERATGLDMAITVVSDVHRELYRFLSPGIMLRLGGS